MSKTFDPKCYDLAALFLSDEPDLNTDAAKVSLAQAIQECIENNLLFMRSVMEKM